MLVASIPDPTCASTADVLYQDRAIQYIQVFKDENPHQKYTSFEWTSCRVSDGIYYTIRGCFVTFISIRVTPQLDLNKIRFRIVFYLDIYLINYKLIIINIDYLLYRLQKLQMYKKF